MPMIQKEALPPQADLSPFEQSLSREMMSAGQTLDSAQDASALDRYERLAVPAPHARWLIHSSSYSHLLPEPMSNNRYLSVVEDSVMTSSSDPESK